MKKTLHIVLLLLFINSRISGSDDRGKLDSLLLVLKKINGSGNRSDTGKINALNLISNEYNTLYENDLALQYASEAYTLAQQAHFVPGMAKALLYTGKADYKQGSYDKAMESTLLCLKLNEKINNKKDMAECYLGMSAIYVARNKFDNALINCNNAMALYKELGDKKGIGMAYNQLGAIYYLRENYYRAEEAYTHALMISKETGDKRLEAYAYDNLGRFYFKQGKYREGIIQSSKAEKLFEESDAKYDLSILYNNLGNFFKALGEYEKAEMNFSKSLDIAQKMKAKNILSLSYFDLSKLYEKTRDFKKAYSFLQKYSGIYDSIVNEKSEKLMVEMDAKYEAGNKDKKILILKNAREKEALETYNERRYRQITLIASLCVFSLFALLVFFAFKNYKSKQWTAMEKVKKEKIAAELDLLKSQIGPHSMFNFLNTIYHQIDEDSHIAKDMLLKFSDLLHFQLYSCNDSFIKIEMETEYLKKMVEMYTYRKSKRCRVEFIIGEGLTGFLIAPIIIAPLIENAFKYVTNDKDNENFIHFSLTQQKNELVFIGANSMYEYEIKNEFASGIGLSNLKSRLDLIYPDKHLLEISKENSIFTIKLTLNV